MKKSKIIKDIANEITFLDPNITFHNAELIADSVLRLLKELGFREPPKQCILVRHQDGGTKHSETEFGFDPE